MQLSEKLMVGAIVLVVVVLAVILIFSPVGDSPNTGSGKTANLPLDAGYGVQTTDWTAVTGTASETAEFCGQDNHLLKVTRTTIVVDAQGMPAFTIQTSKGMGVTAYAMATTCGQQANGPLPKDKGYGQQLTGWRIIGGTASQTADFCSEYAHVVKVTKTTSLVNSDNGPTHELGQTYATSGYELTQSC